MPIPNSEAEWTDMIREAGFVDIKCRAMKQPWNTWAADQKYKAVGRQMCDMASNVLKTYGKSAWKTSGRQVGADGKVALATMTRALGMPVEEVEELCERAISENVSKRKQMIYNFA